MSETGISETVISETGISETGISETGNIAADSSVAGSSAAGITCVLVANRGEIARRVIRTCRELGIVTVAVHSDADAAAPHVREADAAVRLPGNVAADTYLRTDLLVDAAQRAGADAVHPGYGFGAENPDLARAVLAAGLVWIGPPPAAMAAMAGKIEAKARMVAAGVPVLAELDPARVTPADLPVLVKASAGGGGRGMRVVRRVEELAVAVEAASAEAASAFGDPTVFCERYVERGHHVEVQVLADRHGTVWAVGERECSVQRRHQKVVEEAPSPTVERAPGLRQRLYAAAVAAARAVGYESAGTVEFLVAAEPVEPGEPDAAAEPADAGERRERPDAGERPFWFLEMNTRLQVEHPVTELVTGLDLVRLQLDVAEGRRLPQRPPPTRGWAVEARLYAEDPAADWCPSTGVLHRLDVPGVAARFGGLTAPGVRLDAGVDDGTTVGPHYDPLLAKVLAWAPERADAVRRLASALAAARIHGLVTNRDLLVRVLRHPEFAAGATDTAFLDRIGLDVLARPLADAGTERLSALAAALADAAARRAGARVQGGLPSGWRNVPAVPQRARYRMAAGSVEHEVEYRLTRDGLAAAGHPGVRLLDHGPGAVVLEVDGVRRAFAVRRYPDSPDGGGLVCVDSSLGPVALTRVARFVEPADDAPAGSLLAPLPGTVVSVPVAVGEPVEPGRPLVVLEAMKMRHPVLAPIAGTVASVAVAVGDQVPVGAVLAVVHPA